MDLATTRGFLHLDQGRDSWPAASSGEGAGQTGEGEIDGAGRGGTPRGRRVPTASSGMASLKRLLYKRENESGRDAQISATLHLVLGVGEWCELVACRGSRHTRWIGSEPITILQREEDRENEREKNPKIIPKVKGSWTVESRRRGPQKPLACSRDKCEQAETIQMAVSSREKPTRPLSSSWARESFLERGSLVRKMEKKADGWGERRYVHSPIHNRPLSQQCFRSQQTRMGGDRVCVSHHTVPHKQAKL
jgi:hypothetical protein